MEFLFVVMTIVIVKVLEVTVYSTSSILTQEKHPLQYAATLYPS